jgi:hypothetical protein
MERQHERGELTVEMRNSRRRARRERMDLEEAEDYWDMTGRLLAEGVSHGRGYLREG